MNLNFFACYEFEFKNYRLHKFEFGLHKFEFVKIFCNDFECKVLKIDEFIQP